MQSTVVYFCLCMHIPYYASTKCGITSTYVQCTVESVLIIQNGSYFPFCFDYYALFCFVPFCIAYAHIKLMHLSCMSQGRVVEIPYSDYMYPKNRVLFYCSQGVSLPRVAKRLEEEGLTAYRQGLARFFNRYDETGSMAKVPGKLTNFQVDTRGSSDCGRANAAR